MAASTFFFYQDSLAKLDSLLASYIGDTVSNVVGAITPVATTLITIYVMLWGWSMMRGVISEPITDGVTRIVRLSVITGIALSVGRYNTYLSDWLWQTPDALAALVASGGGSSTGNAQFLDQLMAKIYDLGRLYWDTAFASTAGSWISIPNFGLLIVAVAIWAVGLLATGYGAFLLILSKMALAIILGVGPIFVLTTIFEPTKRFFDAWLGQALNYVFLVMLTAAAIKLIFKILEAYLGQPVSASAAIIDALPCLALCLIAALVMMQLTTIASALGGGVAISTMGAARWTFNKARGAAGGMQDIASGKTLSDMRGARRQKAMNAAWAAKNPGVTRRIYQKVTGSTRSAIKKAS